MGRVVICLLTGLVALLVLAVVMMEHAAFMLSRRAGKRGPTASLRALGP